MNLPMILNCNIDVNKHIINDKNVLSTEIYNLIKTLNEYIEDDLDINLVYPLRKYVKEEDINSVLCKLMHKFVHDKYNIEIDCECMIYMDEKTDVKENQIYIVENMNDVNVLNILHSKSKDYKSVILMRPLMCDVRNINTYIIFTNIEPNNKLNIKNIIDFLYCVVHYNIYFIKLALSLSNNVAYCKTKYVNMDADTEYNEHIKNTLYELKEIGIQITNTII